MTNDRIIRGPMLESREGVAWHCRECSTGYGPGETVGGHVYASDFNHDDAAMSAAIDAQIDEHEAEQHGQTSEDGPEASHMTSIQPVMRGMPWYRGGVRRMYRVTCAGCDYLRVVGDLLHADALCDEHERAENIMPSEFRAQPTDSRNEVAS